MKIVPKYLLAWFGLLLLAILNGAVRESAYKNTLGELPAQQVSTLTLILLVTIAVWAVNTRWKMVYSNGMHRDRYAMITPPDTYT